MPCHWLRISIFQEKLEDVNYALLSLEALKDFKKYLRVDSSENEAILNFRQEDYSQNEPCRNLLSKYKMPIEDFANYSLSAYVKLE